ncbi:PEP phosphonomutase [Staphylococcus lutrae]|uniref:PEP phosphonomutase n=1 Tax=Staphylococcus lutrae TaxID=155085 RepID=A0AAC9RVK4_9STAP|nr:PEP phosphonomutase [Staphylococcus lutrae]ARJ51717.1 PEP phosphonomutase [Staphylococcus lutrae]PNZ34187.1 PEP phosphonomutase [Staphylococcus lutrae]
MVKRLISANTSEVFEMSVNELKQSIKASEGRVVLSENVAHRDPWIFDVTNAEMAAAFGADLILLNAVDVFNVNIAGLYDIENHPIQSLKKLCGRPVGVNLEPVDGTVNMMDDRFELEKGRTANHETLLKLNELGVDFVCFTGNPGTGVSNTAIVESVKQAKQLFNGLIFAGKMHSSGVDEAVVNLELVKTLIEAGEDVILVPSIGCVPGITLEMIHDVVQLCHTHGALVMSAIGTSQEGASKETIRYFAIQNKMAGVDIQHIGDAGYGGLAPVENIFELGIAIRGLRHTASKMSRSILR